MSNNIVSIIRPWFAIKLSPMLELYNQTSSILRNGDANIAMYMKDMRRKINKYGKFSIFTTDLKNLFGIIIYCIKFCRKIILVMVGEVFADKRLSVI